MTENSTPEVPAAKSHRRELNVPGPVVSLIALLFTGAMLWNIAIGGEGMVTIALASAVPFIIGVPVGRAFLNGGGGGGG
jgi:hypothetical protein